MLWVLTMCPKDVWWVADDYFFELVEWDWVLMFGQVRFTKENVECIDVGSNGLLEKVSVVLFYCSNCHCPQKGDVVWAWWSHRGGGLQYVANPIMWGWNTVVFDCTSCCPIAVFPGGVYAERGRCLHWNVPVDGCSVICWIGSQLTGLKLEPNMSPHCRNRMEPMTNKKAPITSEWCLSCWKHDLTSLACMAMLWLGYDICKFQKRTKKSTTMDPKLQSSLMMSFVEVMRLMGMESIMGRSVALKMSLSFLPSLIRLCCSTRNKCATNYNSQAGRGMKKLLYSPCSFFSWCPPVFVEIWVVACHPTM